MAFRATIDMVKGQADRISQLTGEKYGVDNRSGMWRLNKYNGRDGGDWEQVASAYTITKLHTYLTAFIHGAEVVARRYRK